MFKVQSSIIEVKNLSKSFTVGVQAVPVLKGDGMLTEDNRSQFRKEHVGMVYQQPNWIKALTVVENVAFPLSLLGEDKGTSIQKAAQILQSIGMANWAGYQTSELSSGQQQRIALGRALITNPVRAGVNEVTS